MFMFKFKSITQFVTNAVTKYKAQRVRDVVSQYYATVEAQVLSTLLVAIDFYRDAAHKIVDKTFENPEPALKLIEALDAVTKHYGPALTAEFKEFSAELDDRGASPVVTKRIEALVAAVEALTNDAS